MLKPVPVFCRCLLIALAVLALFGRGAQAQEIEARLYSNAPVNYNFLGVGFTQITTNKFQLNTELLAYNRTFDFFGQSGKVNVIVPWGEYNSNQLFNVGANRTFIQPGLVVWRHVVDAGKHQQRDQVSPGRRQLL